ncbi:hypothetical protein QVH35_06225 [Candidatus Nitrosotenuis chungbukensis]|uniref:hypothetical protein n=1 Tax=Candidatus Nitrosotenuis chungbukensis TaxID=1353246 RepID=UPI002672BA28|nr:hypothetical protein [Candidatus Nitrosotenuis chungbukensis]WKT57063.1 hypothetical protein QVH35_06225 [Candidatus Nitrosotenuis chungbukensis]
MTSKLAPKESLERYLGANYDSHEAVLVKNIIFNSFDKISNLDDLLGRITAVSKFSHNLLGKVILFEA